jgi:chromate reductase, NAD(P)H dehydrogenase (quinone)
VTKILAISGSLRAGSLNTAILQASAALAPADVSVNLYSGLARLPFFNPDLDIDPAPPAVNEFRSELLSSDAVLISSPEYAHGVPGSLKNALDWVVRSGELYEKPVGLINVSSRSIHAQASLVETLSTMAAKLIPEACVTLALTVTNTEVSTISANPDLAQHLSSVMAAVARVAVPGGWPSDHS